MGREMVRLLKLLELVGAFVLRRLDDLGTIVLLYRDTMRELGHKPRLRHILAQMSHLGVDSLLIVSLTLLFTGVVMTLQTADILIRFGAQGTIGGIISIAIGRELGPVLVGVVCAGRVGAAITAEISTMKVTEQIDALRVMAVSPVNYLIVPRMIACMIVVPILTVFGDIIGVIGGWFVAVYYNGISSYLFMNSIHKFTEVFDITGGVIKAVFFGNVIAVLGCYYGLHSPDGAEGVGKATTKTVVSSIIVIFILNAVLTFVLY
ncbi:phospholipid/cholesterol/gamma-HCH transport system permease protein [Selenomonas ruminantium]|uniref:Phospholipid/cholesterol/gamma-HCH transport system permease protein n=1 Tax=Selenomonas ruminantium TaxID=971 RepID=A0A1I3DLU3_SELRU|nr:phospholipid/cholesterol/gamma-HCH transport system permease protein [Selenomonas ruminantium]